MTAETTSLPENTLGYAYNGGGLNNQKLALFGLCLKAHREGPRRIILPNLLLFDQITFNHRPVPFSDHIELEPLRAFLDQQGIEVVPGPSRGDRGGWGYFHYGNNYLPYAMLAGELGIDSFACDFFRSLVAIAGRSRLFQDLADRIFGQRGIRLVAQLRIEADWGRHSAQTLAGTLPDGEDYSPSFRDILAKITATLPEVRAAYVVCDEAALPVSKEEIRRTVQDEFDIDLVWKSDVVPADALAGLSLLDLSIIDFEMAVAADSFVGMSRSTFSNMVSLEKFARTRKPPSWHYIYNLPGPKLARRRDNGAFSAPDMVGAEEPHAAILDFAQAQIYLDVGERSKALEHYLGRAARGGGSSEEIYISLYRAAQLMAALNHPPAEIIATYLRAADALPSRAEALHGAARFCRDHKLFAEGYDIAKRGVDLPVPARGLFIERWIYDYGLLDELAVNGYWSGHYWDCAQASLLILERDTAPSDNRKRIIRNALFALDQMKPPPGG